MGNEYKIPMRKCSPRLAQVWFKWKEFVNTHFDVLFYATFADDKLTTKSPVKLENTNNTYICSGKTTNETTRYMESHISFIEFE